MRIHLAVLRFIVFVVLASSCSFAEAQKIVKRVVIHSSAGGLGGGSNTLVVIQRRRGKYLLNGQPVSAVQVQSLAAALSAPPLTNLDMTNLGMWLDYSAYCKVEIVFENGSKLSAESYSYSSPFMLPWSMKGRGVTYNADISRAIAALLPAQAANKGTLAGDELASELAGEVMRSIEPEWNLLRAEERAGEALKTLRTAYEVITADLTPYLHHEYGTYAYFDALEEIDLHAIVRRSNFPSNVTDILVLRYADKKAEGVDEFLKSAAKYEDLALSVPWLNDYIRDNPHAAVRISYVHGKSFGDKAMGVFAADMKLLGREDLIEQVKSQQAGIALLLINDTNTESHWLLFPDKHMMLWRYDGSSRLLKWTPEDFRKGGRECSDSLMIHPIVCSGCEISAEGMLAPSTRR